MDKIELFLCPVCKNMDESGECNRTGKPEQKEVCVMFSYYGSRYARWIFDCDCPACEDGGMLAQDKFGAFCAVCGFSQPYVEI